jgi:hypothetical protein
MITNSRKSNVLSKVIALSLRFTYEVLTPLIALNDAKDNRCFNIKNFIRLNVHKTVCFNFAVKNNLKNPEKAVKA